MEAAGDFFGIISGAGTTYYKQGDFRAQQIISGSLSACGAPFVALTTWAYLVIIIKELQTPRGGRPLVTTGMIYRKKTPRGLGNQMFQYAAGRRRPLIRNQTS